MDEKVRETLATLNEQLGDFPCALDIVDPHEIRLLEKNARYMTQEMFSNLVDNIKRDRGLSGLPLCYRQDGTLIVLSGNHRVQAAVHAGIDRILVLIIKKELSREEQVAVQLSHNAIEGKDDLVTLKELWSEIETVDLKLYAGLDSEILKELDKMQFLALSEARPDFKQISLAFLPEEIEQIKAILQDAHVYFSGEENYVLSRAYFDKVFELIVTVKETFNIVNNPTAFLKVVELAREALDSLARSTGRGS